MPIIGMGGVSDGADALELILAGATCVGVGTAMFRNEYRPGRQRRSVPQQIEHHLHEYLEERGQRSMKDLVGKAAG